MYDHVLNPGQCSEVLDTFRASGFTHDGSSFVSLSLAIQAYAKEHKFPGSYLSASRHLYKLQTWDFKTSAPPGHRLDGGLEYGSTRPPYVCDIADESSNSYGPMGLFELYAGARMTPSTRFHRSMSFMHVKRALHLAFKRDVRDLREESQWGTRHPWHKRLRSLYFQFFNEMARPKMTGMPTLTEAFDCIHNVNNTMRSSDIIYGSMATWPFFPSSRDPELAVFFTTNGEPCPIDNWGEEPLTSRQQAPSRHLGTTQSRPRPTTEAELMPFDIPLPWDVIINLLFAYTPDNNWVISCNPKRQRLEGNSALTFRNCRATCKTFDDHMLRYMERYTMTPIRNSSNGHQRCTFEIEFTQREFIVSAQMYRCQRTRLWVIRRIHREFRQYDKVQLRVTRKLVRRDLHHDGLPLLEHSDPSIQYWIDQAADLTLRRRDPVFLPSAEVRDFQKRCRRTAWTFNSWADAMCDLLHDYAAREPECPWADPEGMAQWG